MLLEKNITNEKYVKAIHTLVLPVELNSVRFSNHLSIFHKKLESLGYSRVELPYFEHYVVIHTATFERTKKLYMYGSDMACKHIIGKKGASIIKLKSKIGADIISANNHEMIYPKQDMSCFCLTDDTRVRLNKEIVSLMPIDILCDIDTLTDVIEHCLKLNVDNLLCKLALNAINASQEYGGISGLKACIKLCKQLDKENVKFGNLFCIEPDFGYVKTLFTMHWGRISATEYPIHIDEV